MPSPNSRKTLCVFGDSHIGCMKMALTEKKFTTQHALDFEFWGADGPRFRSLDLVGSTLVPRLDAIETVRMVNGKGKDILDPRDFEAILFMAARTRVQEFFPGLLHRMKQADGFITQAVFRQICHDWLTKHRFYRAAKAMAETGSAQIFLAPTSFLTEGADIGGHSGALQAGSADRKKIWDELVRVAAGDGIILIPQPEETVVNGCMSRKEYAAIIADGRYDPVHRNSDYAALLFEALIAEMYPSE